MEDIRDIKGVLRYLLENDEDWQLDPKEKFLCNRVQDMHLVGLDHDLAESTQRWIMRKISPDLTLASYAGTSTYEEGYPLIRQDYLRQWIRELEHDQSQAARR